MSRDLRRGAVGSVQRELRGLSTEIDRLDGIAAGQFGLNRTDLRCLELLGQTGGLTPTALAHALGFTTGGATTVIDRLEAAGYARRQLDPHDRRRRLVAPTRLIAERESQIFGPLIESTEALISAYSEAELATIGDFVRRVREATAAHAERLLKHELVSVVE